MELLKNESLEKPSRIFVDADCVYINSDITQKTRVDEMSKETTTYYEYTTKKLTIKEYNKLLSEEFEIKGDTTDYEKKVLALIREEYSASDENAILRKKLAGLDTGEFDIYNAFVEECKVKAKE